VSIHSFLSGIHLCRADPMMDKDAAEACEARHAGGEDA